MYYMNTSIVSKIYRVYIIIIKNRTINFHFLSTHTVSIKVDECVQ